MILSYLEYIENVEQDPSCVLTVGTFDGVHVGHRAILHYLVSRAATLGGRSAVVTFDPHPREIVGTGDVSLLTTVEERADICFDLGIDRFVVIPFTEAFSTMSPIDFISEILLSKIGMREMVIGHDHHFGHGRSGNENVLLGLAEKLGFSIDVVPAKIMDESVVSSSEIRRLICEEGNLSRANEQLGYAYGLSARVIEGLRRGREIGFPTANILPIHTGKLVPANGVYAVMVSVDGDDNRYVGMMNIGIRPTFEDTGRHLEVHIVNFDEDIYGRRVQVQFISRIRSERKFDSVQDLVTQLKEDRERCIAFAELKP